MPHSIKSLRKKKFVVTDKYKPDLPKIPTQGALVVVFCTFFTVSISSIISKIIARLGENDRLVIDELDIAMMLVVSLFALYGILDDLIDVGWWPKVLLPVTFSFPLMTVFEPKTIAFPFFGELDISSINFEFTDSLGLFSDDIFKVIIIPIYIMVVANLVNMHSGFNGLQSGLSCILLSTIIFFSIINGDSENLIPVVCLLASMLVLWYYNKYPAKIFEGNIGSMTFGATIGCIIVIKEYYIFGIIILMPHIIDFVLWFYESRILKKTFTKFGDLNEDGTINSPTPMKLKFTLPYYFKFDEKRTVYYLHFITFIFCFFGILLFRI